jgi:hypothetical protein
MGLFEKPSHRSEFQSHQGPVTQMFDVLENSNQSVPLGEKQRMICDILSVTAHIFTGPAKLNWRRAEKGSGLRLLDHPETPLNPFSFLFGLNIIRAIRIYFRLPQALALH